MTKKTKNVTAVIILFLSMMITSNSFGANVSAGLDVQRLDEPITYTTLTDGITHSLWNQGGEQLWFGSSGTKTISLKIDLQEVYDLQEIRLNMVNGAYWGVTSPHLVEFNVSNDDVNWNEAANLTFSKAIDNSTKININYNSDQYYWSSTGTLVDVSARYVRIDFTMDMDTYNKQVRIGEIEVIAKEEVVQGDFLSSGLGVTNTDNLSVYYTLTNGITYKQWDSGGEQLWFGSSGTKTIGLKIDLGEIYDIGEIKLHMVSGAYWGIASPHLVEFKVSDDDIVWSLATSIAFDKAVDNTTKINPFRGNDQYFWNTTGMLSDVSGRYLLIDFTMQMDTYNKEMRIDQIQVIKSGCGHPSTFYFNADINRDCYVNIEDFAEIASMWLIAN